MEYNVLKQSIAAVVKANGNEEITGDLLQQVLIAMVDVLGAGYQFAGLAVPTTNPGTPDAKMFYIATQAGTYSNFGSPAPVLNGEQVAILRFSTSWTAVVLDIPTKAYLTNALSGKVDKVEGKGLSANDLTNELVTLINGAFQKANITDELGTDATKVLSQAAITTVLLQYAKVDGYYSSLTAGAAENLVGRGSVPASFLRRTTGGSADVGTGSAKIAKLMGNSIVWNQLVKNGKFAEDTTTNWALRRSSASFAGNVLTVACTENGEFSLIQASILTRGHKVLIKLRAKASVAMNIGLGGNYNNMVAASSTFSEYTIIDVVGNGAHLEFVKGSGNIGDTLDIDTDYGIVLYDLTKMFRAGKEPSTVAEFEALFPLGFYAANVGEMLPFAAQKLVTTGFNQFNPATGIAKLLGGNKYQLTGTYTAATIDGVAVTLDAEDCFTPDADCELVITGGNEIDTCVHLVWSGYRNGEFEPFELHEAIFDPANWEDANGNKIFPYGGMHGIGTARDFATPDADGFIRKATRVFVKVNLGDLTWENRGTGGDYERARTTGLRGTIANNNAATIANAICSKYDVITNSAVYSHSAIGIGVMNSDEDVAIYSPDLIGLTGEQIQAALNGVYLCYELLTPVEIELAEPVAASYYANDFGTEEWQPANDDEPYTAPCEMQIAYAMNAVDTLRRLPENYISVGSFENFCTELATKLGAALNKNITITPTYDSENAEYDYSITIADIEG